MLDLQLESPPVTLLTYYPFERSMEHSLPDESSTSEAAATSKRSGGERSRGR